MALSKVSKVLSANNQEATIWVAGQAKAGISVRSVTGTATLSFLGSLDGIQYSPITVAAVPAVLSSTQGSLAASGITTTTTTGNYEFVVQNYQFLRVQLTTGSGPITVVMTASTDGSYQEAFLSDAQGVSLGVLYPSTSSSAGVNTMTLPAQANRCVNLTFLEVAMAGPGGGANAQLRIWDGSVGNGAPLYSCYLAPAAGSVGTCQLINLPKDAQGNVGIQGTPGNALVVQIVNLSGVTAIMNARMSYL